VTAPDGGGSGRGFSFRRDISVTVLGQAAVLVGGLVLYRLLATKKGATGLASYALVKQLVVFVFPAVMLGLQTAIPRYVSLGRSRAGDAESYLLASILITGASTALVCGLALVSPRTTASILIGKASRSELVVPLLATLVATVVLEVTAGYLRGRLDFVIRTVLLVIGVAGFPVVLLLVAPGKAVATLITLMAAGLLALCVMVVLPPVFRAIGLGAARVGEAGRTLANYGFRRIPGEAAAIGLFTLAPIAAAHVAPLRQVAFLTAGLQILSIVAITFQSIGLVFLPVLSHLWETDRDTARRYVGILTACALHVAIFATPQLLLFADVAAQGWLGSAFKDAGSIIRITMFPVAFYVFYLVLHTALDAAAVKSYNSRNRVIALTVAAGAAAITLSVGLGRPITAIAWSFAIGVLCLGLLTLRSVHTIFGLARSQYSVGPAVLLGVLAAAAGFLARGALDPDGSLSGLIPITGLELALAALYVAALVRAGVEWPLEVRKRIVRRSA
jgi:O-antigen/teichoic acid export membrane protein